MFRRSTRNDLYLGKARNFLQIPVPRILEWSATSHNPVGSEYIIMEEAAGTPLGRLWDTMSPDSKLAIMGEAVSIETRMLSVSFSRYVFLLTYYCVRMLIIRTISYGSIYFASDTVDGAVPAEITSEAPAELKEQVSKTFTIGPTVDRDFWNKERSTMDIFRGPCRY